MFDLLSRCWCSLALLDESALSLGFSGQAPPSPPVTIRSDPDVPAEPIEPCVPEVVFLAFLAFAMSRCVMTANPRLINPEATEHDDF